MIDTRSLRSAVRTLLPDTPEKALMTAASAALVVAGARRSKTAERFIKPLVMSSIAAGLWRTRAERGGLDNALLGTAAAASFAGDLLMMEEEFAEGEQADVWIQRGAAAFAVSHVATISLALRHGARPGAKELLPRVGGLLEGVALLATRQRNLFVPLVAYSKSLALMSTVVASPQLSAGTPDDDPRRALDLGGVLFLTSDAALMHRRVFLDKDSPAGAAAESWVLGSYTSAQALLFSGLAKLAAVRAG
jgi:uncharacterized membrane protein YhhN